MSAATPFDEVCADCYATVWADVDGATFSGSAADYHRLVRDLPRRGERWRDAVLHAADAREMYALSWAGREERGEFAEALREFANIDQGPWREAFEIARRYRDQQKETQP